MNTEKFRYVYGQEIIECKCGVWRVNELDLGCWNHGEKQRAQLMVEAVAQLNQAVRNLGYEVLHALRLV